MEKEDEDPFDLEVPSFMRDPEEEKKPSEPKEIKRRIFVDEAAAPAEAKEAFSAPAPTPAAPVQKAVSGEEIWEKTKNALSGNMPFGLYLLLTDPTQVDAYMQGSELVLSVKSSFAMNMLNRPDIAAFLPA